GLENGRVHVVHRELLDSLAHGFARNPKRSHYFAIETSDAVLEVQTMRPADGRSNAAYVLAALRDQSLCLFEVTTLLVQRTLVHQHWKEYVRHAIGSGRSRVVTFAEEIAVAERDPPSEIDPRAWTYMLVDEVLPRLAANAVLAKQRERLIDVACELA